MEIIKVENLSKSFGSLKVIRDISFTVNSGEVLAVIGPSGSGKSTLLRSITHLETVSGGTVTIGGEDMVRDGQYASPSQLRSICLKVGLVFQNFNLFPHLSVMDNVAEAQIRVLNRTRNHAEARARELLGKIGLADKEHSYPCELSGGQQQRVSIARALALNPQVLFFDEPTSALDPELTGEILKVIRTLAAEKMTMVIVTHEMHFARDVADRVIFMDEGVIVEQGPARSVIEQPRSERTKAFLSRFSSRDA
ncbi:MAG TPA: amino acid ABC transporter ATP-binding protein [Treponemataceae bacterium]|nr:amino acid ABC transporter ATP-binding protein [Treponemataceae bacterium]